MKGAGLHGLFGGLAEGGGALGEADAGKLRGAFVEVVGHGAQAWRDDAASVGGACVDDVEGDCCSEVDDDGWGGAL